MSTLLDKPLKRELAIADEAYTLTISPEGLKLVPKGRRIGVELQWQDLVSGQAALAVALNASLERAGARDRGLAAAAAAVAPGAETPATASTDARRRPATTAQIAEAPAKASAGARRDPTSSRRPSGKGAVARPRGRRRGT